VPKKAAPKIKSAASLPTILKKWRAAKGYTKADAARHMDIPYRTFQDWELGNRTPSGFTLRAILAEVKRR
jgi:DNA-binding transcriptional regulator YiaG